MGCCTLSLSADFRCTRGPRQVCAMEQGSKRRHTNLQETRMSPPGCAQLPVLSHWKLMVFPWKSLCTHPARASLVPLLQQEHRPGRNMTKALTIDSSALLPDHKHSSETSQRVKQ